MCTRSFTVIIDVCEEKLPKVDAFYGGFDGHADAETSIFGFPKASHIRKQFGSQQEAQNACNGPSLEVKGLSPRERSRSSLGGDNTQDQLSQHSGRRRAPLAKMRKVPPSSMSDSGHRDITSSEPLVSSSLKQDELLLRNCGYNTSAEDEISPCATGRLSERQRKTLFAARERKRLRRRHRTSVDILGRYHHFGRSESFGSSSCRSSVSLEDLSESNSSVSSRLQPLIRTQGKVRSARLGIPKLCQKQRRSVYPRCHEPLADPQDVRHGLNLCAQALLMKPDCPVDRASLPLRFKTSFVSLGAGRHLHSDRVSDKTGRFPDWLHIPGRRTRHLMGSGVYERAEMVGHGR